MHIPSRTGATTGVAFSSPPSHRKITHRGRKSAYAGVALTTLGMSLFVAPGAASAALPLSADTNFTVFPNRDMVVLEGWEGRVGQAVTVEVRRAGELMGATTGTIATGGVGLEINHPGGACWGNQPDLPQVTPDIRPGDVVIAKFVDSGTAVTYETTVQDANVATSSDPIMNAAGTGFTVTGHIADSVPGARFEQRIINPDLADTEIGRRDIRALDGPLTPAPKGGYSSGVVIDRAADTFLATYQFTDPNAARNAATAQSSGGERAMAWESVDAAGERLGLTIAEDDEPGGPGMGGCPAGPADAAATPGAFTTTPAADGKTTVSWTPAASQPGAAAVTGYSVVAIAKTATAGTNAVVGVRTAADAKSATLTYPASTTAADYDVEVRALLANGDMGKAFPRANGATTPPPDGTVDIEAPPAVTVTRNATGAVVLSNTEATADIFFTLGTDPVLTNDDLGPNAVVFDPLKPIAVTATTTVNFVAFDRAGNHTVPVTQTFEPQAAGPITAPAVPAGLTVTPAPARLTVNWVNPANTGNAPLTRIQVRINAPAVTGANPAPAIVNQIVNVNADATTGVVPQTRVLTGLINGRVYSIDVRAQNAGATNELRSSPWTTAVTGRPGDTVSAALKLNDPGSQGQRFGGTSSQRNTATVPLTIQVFRTTDAAAVGNPANTGSTSLGNATVTNLVAPAVGSEWELRLSNAQAFPAGTIIWVRSSGGGVASFTI
jgi:hypothetical protein